jgi:membrane associated rhomboid family serine protease
MQAPPPITRALLIACTVFLFAAQLPSLALPMGQWLALHPALGGFWPWQLVTYPFVNSDPLSWLFNMMMIYYFGTELEGIWGERRFIQFVLASVLAGAAVYLLVSLLPPLLGWPMPTSVMFDSSAITMGLLVAVGILFPQRTIRLYFVLEVTQRVAAWAGVGIIVFIALGRFGNGSGAWAASLGILGGALGGYLMLLYWRWRPPSFRRKKPPTHIRRVH